MPSPWAADFIFLCALSNFTICDLSTLGIFFNVSLAGIPIPADTLAFAISAAALASVCIREGAFWISGIFFNVSGLGNCLGALAIFSVVLATVTAVLSPSIKFLFENILSNFPPNPTSISFASLAFKDGLVFCNILAESLYVFSIRRFLSDMDNFLGSKIFTTGLFFTFAVKLPISSTTLFLPRTFFNNSVTVFPLLPGLVAK